MPFLVSKLVVFPEGHESVLEEETNTVGNIEATGT